MGIFQRAWDSASPYTAGDVRSFSGVAYEAVNDITANTTDIPLIMQIGRLDT